MWRDNTCVSAWPGMPHTRPTHHMSAVLGMLCVVHPSQSRRTRTSVLYSQRAEAPVHWVRPITVTTCTGAALRSSSAPNSVQTLSLCRDTSTHIEPLLTVYRPMLSPLEELARFTVPAQTARGTAFPAVGTGHGLPKSTVRFCSF